MSLFSNIKKNGSFGEDVVTNKRESIKTCKDCGSDCVIDSEQSSYCTNESCKNEYHLISHNSNTKM